MRIEILIPFLAIIALAVYFQTVTGFGLGMIVMGTTGGLELVSVATIATATLLTQATPAHLAEWRTGSAAGAHTIMCIFQCRI